MKVTLTTKQVRIIKENNLLPSISQSMSNNLWVIPLKNLSKEEVNHLIALLFEYGIYDFAYQRLGRKNGIVTIMENKMKLSLF